MFKDFKPHGWGQVGSGSDSGNNDCCILGSYNDCMCGSRWAHGSNGRGNMTDDSDR